MKTETGSWRFVKASLKIYDRCQEELVAYLEWSPEIKLVIIQCKEVLRSAVERWAVHGLLESLGNHKKGDVREVITYVDDCDFLKNVERHIKKTSGLMTQYYSISYWVNQDDVTVCAETVDGDQA